MPRHRADRVVRPYGFFRCHREAKTGVTDCHDQSADWSRNDSVGANGCKGCGGEK